nr:VOC family protein [uncultured Erwinia sp.]
MKNISINSTLFASALLLGAVSFSATALEVQPEPVVKISGLDHGGINVPDVEAAVSFFVKTFGAKVESDSAPGAIPQEWKTAFNWRSSSELKRFVMVRLPDGSGIELFQYSGPEIDRTQPHEDDAAATHIALRTHDIQASYRALKQSGLKILNEPVTNADGTQWFYFLTPWGSQIELVAEGVKSA